MARQAWTPESLKQDKRARAHGHSYSRRHVKVRPEKLSRRRTNEPSPSRRPPPPPSSHGEVDEDEPGWLRDHHSLLAHEKFTSGCLLVTGILGITG